MGRIRIGVSGWRYDHWRGTFYPEELPRSGELAYLAERFDTLEINATFYSLSDPASFRSWYASVPAGFVLAVKGSRYITHQKKLADTGSALANFMASGILELDDKLGPILWQLPPRLRFDRARIEAFLQVLPHDTHAAARMARHHDDRVPEPVYGPGANHRLRHVLEVRHRSHLCDELVSLARRHGVALAFSHSWAWPYVEEVTAGFVYLRLHGPGALYASSYGPLALARWAERIRRWHAAAEPRDARRITARPPPARKERDVYVFFDNDGEGHAPREAASLRELVGRG